MNLKELTETIILKLVKNTEAVSVEENEEDNQIIINAYVSNEDMGRVIGKDGKIINSIRTILQASSYMQNNISVKLNVLEKKDQFANPLFIGNGSNWASIHSFGS